MEIKINNLIKRYGSKTAVDIPDFTLHEGEILGLVGNNGAGKTTLFRLMLDLLQADSGTVCMNGTDVARSEEWKTFTGAYIDESFLIDYLTPDEYFQFYGRMCGLDRSTVNERIRRYERFLGPEILEEKKFIRNLSAGNKQKIGIVNALLQNPQIVILDEPFNFLDPTSQSLLKHILPHFGEEHNALLLRRNNDGGRPQVDSDVILFHGLFPPSVWRHPSANSAARCTAYSGAHSPP